MTNQNPKNSNTLFIGASTLFAGVVIGGATFVASRNAIATLFSGAGGAAAGAAISSVVKRKEQENQKNPTEQTQITDGQKANDITLPPVIDNEKITVVEWIEKKGIKCSGYSITQEEKTEFEKEKYQVLATYIAENFDNPAFKEVYEIARKNINYNVANQVKGGKPYKIPLPENEKDFEICKKFCELLHEYGFLYERVSFAKIIENNRPRNPHQTDINLLPNEFHQKFLNSMWLELYIYHKISDVIQNCFKGNNWPLENDTNIKFDRFSIGENKFVTHGEIDIFFLIDSLPLWIECKTFVTEEQERRFLLKYSDIAKKLSIPKERAFLIIWDWTNKKIENIGTWPFTIVNRKSFEQKIKRAIRNSQREPKINNEGKSPLDIISEQYNPVSEEHRKAILQGLINLFSQTGHEGYSLYEAEDELVNKMSGITRLQIHQCLKVVWNGHCLLNNQGYNSDKFYRIASQLKYNDVEQLEQKCIEQYIRIALKQKRDFLDTSDNLAKFEQLIGVKIDKKIIDDVKHNIPHR